MTTLENGLLQLRACGQSPWCDHLSRESILDGQLSRLVFDQGIVGLTSNPTILQKALASSTAYDEQIRCYARQGADVNEIYERIAVAEIQIVCDLLKPVFDASGGLDGYVSLEVSPEFAHDAKSSVLEARRLHAAVDRRNLLIKIPATEAGLHAVETLLGEGIGVNATLLFGIERYRALLAAWMRGLQAARRRTLNLGTIASVASFFVSRVDTLIDRLLAEWMAVAGSEAERQALGSLQGKIAVANARRAYKVWQEFVKADSVRELIAAGARVQRLLWASTSTKNPKYRDVLYVEELVGPETVNTMPIETIEAFVDHGSAMPDALTAGLAESEEHLKILAACGIDIRQVAADLETQGIAAFVDSFQALRGQLAAKAGTTQPRRKLVPVDGHTGLRPIFVGIGGDSGTGKTTLASAFYELFGAQRISTICLDDYHSLDRRQRALVGFTALDPRANDFALMEEQLWKLKRCDEIDKPIYDHSDGTIKGPERMKAGEVVIAQGLHPLLAPGIRHAFDLSVWLEPEAELRIAWKVQRDVAKRGYTRAEVIAELEARRPDAEAYINPQREHADMVVRFFRKPGTNDMGRLSVRVTQRHSLPRLDFDRALLSAKAVHLYLDVVDEDGRRSDVIEIDGQITAEEAAIVEANIWEHVDGRHGTLHHVPPELLGHYESAARQRRHSDPLALTQLILAHRILSAQKSFLLRVTDGKRHAPRLEGVLYG